MQAALALALLAAPLLAQGPARKNATEATNGIVKVLREGRWKLSVGGPICNACTRAVTQALRSLDGVTAASYDFEQGSLEMTVARGKQVRAAQIERLLRDAARRVDLQVRFVLSEARYEGTLPESEKPAPAPAPKAAPAPAPKPQLPPADFPEPTP